MSVEVFTWCVDLAGAGAQTKFNMLQANFGDGYTQAVSVGINSKQQNWAVQKTGRITDEIADIKAFIDRHLGAKTFYWTSPRGTQGRYRIAEYAEQPLGGDAWRLSWTFEQVFYP